jgi:hypothetical protein
MGVHFSGVEVDDGKNVISKTAEELAAEDAEDEEKRKKRANNLRKWKEERAKMGNRTVAGVGDSPQAPVANLTIDDCICCECRKFRRDIPVEFAIKLGASAKEDFCDCDVDE